jgi:hypothetical protein
MVPPAVQEVVDFAILRTAGMNDGEESECCARCQNRSFSSGEGPLLWSSECKAPIVFNSHFFTVLPLLAVVVGGLTNEQIKQFLKTDSPAEGNVVDATELIDKTGNEDESPTLGPEQFAKLQPASIIMCEWKRHPHT